MTYKEYVKEHHPVYLHNDYKGGVFGCPFEFGLKEEEGLCMIQKPLNGTFVLANDKMCAACWNQEMKGETNV